LLLGGFLGLLLLSSLLCDFVILSARAFSKEIVVAYGDKKMPKRNLPI
jgi:hypothetical protein